MEKAFFVYAWDMIGEGPEKALKQMGDLGANTVCLASSYHAGKFTRPRASEGKIYFPEDGTVYFRPDPIHYGTIQPRMNPLVEQFDFFQDWEKWNNGLNLKAWTVCAHNTPLGQAFPQYCVRNAFGDPYFYNLCPASDEVQDYLRALCLDLASHDSVQCITLETPGYLPFTHGYHHEFGFVPLNPWVEALLALCFSDATKTKVREAGVDAEGLQKWVRKELERFFSSGVYPENTMATQWLMADLIQEPDLVAYLQAESRIVSNLVQSIRENLPKDVRLNLIPTVQRPTAGCWVEGTDLKGMAAIFDGIDACAYQKGADEIFQDAWDVRNRLGEETQLNFVLRPAHPDLENKPQLLESIHKLKTLNPAGISFYNYGFLPQQNLEWTQEAFEML
jgi:hypothetical protein